MTVSSASDRNTYLGDGATDVYSYTFRIFEESDLEVWVRDAAGVLSQLVLTTDYTVDGVGDGAGGDITLVAGDLEADAILIIRRVLPLTQETSVRGFGPTFKSLEDQLDRDIMIAQQLNERTSRALQLPIDETPTNDTLTVPTLADRASSFAAWDADGALIPAAGLTEVPVSTFMATVLDDTSAAAARSTLGALPAVVSTIAALKALATTNLAGSVFVLGYTAAGDKGGGLFRYNVASVAADNGGTIIAPTAGSGRWERVYQGNVWAEWFGATGDAATNDSAAALSAITAFEEVHFGEGTFKLATKISIPNRRTRIVGHGACVFTTSASNIILEATNHDKRLEVEGVKFTGNGPGIKWIAAPSGTQYDDFYIRACRFMQSAGTYGLWLDGAREGRVESCYFETCDGVYRTRTVNTDFVACDWKNCAYGVNDDGDGTPYCAGLNIMGGTMVGCTIGVREFLSDDCRLNGVMIDYCDAPVKFIGQDGARVWGCYISSRTTNPAIECDYDAGSGDRSKSIKIVGGNTIICHDVTGAAPNGNADAIYLKRTDEALIADNDITFWTRYGIQVENCTNCRIKDNNIAPRTTWGVFSVYAMTGDDASNVCDSNILSKVPSIASANGMRVRRNRTYVTEAQGNAAIGAGNTTVVVSHGLSVTPPLAGVKVCPATSWGSATKFWVTSITSTQFTITVDVAPGGAGMTFAWEAIYHQ